MSGSPQRWRIVFMGTPEFAVPSLEGLISAGRDEVVAVARLPRLANGKIDQPAASALAESLLAGREG